MPAPFDSGVNLGNVREPSSGFLATVFAHGVTFEVDAVGAVDEPVENGIRHGGVTDEFVPAGWRELAGDERGGPGVAVIRVPSASVCAFFRPVGVE